MTTVQLNTWNVAELDPTAAIETDGGFVWFIVAGVALLAASCQSGSGNNQAVGWSNTQHARADSNQTTSHGHVHGHLHVEAKK
ncbi:hypothetical protein VF13_39400 [Nostoc linckia z16]|nr:hypothetical protein VF12_37055 [Nostoc linckia z15]PHK31000.1 hypothetical protein VF13_39400 [Nostoc linckia z16]